MSRLVHIGRRVELIAADSIFNDISIGLYAEEVAGETNFKVHTYSPLEGAADRIKFVSAAMEALGAMEPQGEMLRFSCGSSHLLACRRLFVEAAREPSGEPVAKPLSIFDAKSERSIVLVPLGDGRYEVTADGPEEGRVRRTSTVARGLMKLAGLEIDPVMSTKVGFSCRHDHHALVGLLLVRALNIRATMREIEERSAKGSLTAPGASEG